MSVKRGKKTGNFRGFPISDSIEKEDKLLIENFSFYLKGKYKINNEQLKQIISKKETKITIPVSIFNKKLGSLEAIIKFLKENYKLSFKEISKLLNRRYTTIVNSYKNSLKKFPKRLIVSDVRYSFPISILKNRKYSVLEVIVSYLREELKMGFSGIAELLERDARTIWTVYKRKQQKIPSKFSEFKSFQLYKQQKIPSKFSEFKSFQLYKEKKDA